MSGFVYRGHRPHACNPGWRSVGDRHLILQRAAPGDVWQCGCGVCWVAHDAPSNHAEFGQRTHKAVVWRREGWWARRVRIRQGRSIPPPIPREPTAPDPGIPEKVRP